MGVFMQKILPAAFFILVMMCSFGTALSFLFLDERL
jgi:hypothetical protein